MSRSKSTGFVPPASHPKPRKPRAAKPRELAAPEAEAAQPSDKPMYTEVGKTGLKQMMGFVEEAYHTDLRWPACSALYSRLRRSDPEVSIVRQAFDALARKVNMKWELPDNPSDDDKRAQEFGEQVLEDMEGGTTLFLSTCNSHVPFNGWGWWECVPGMRDPNWTPPAKDDDWRSQYDDGLVGIRRLAWRDSSSLAHWGFDPENGRLTSMVQLPYSEMGKTYEIPLSQSLHLTFGDANNPEGLSPLETVWRLERIKYGFEIIAGIGFEHSSGYLDVTKTESGSWTADDKAMIKAAARSIQTAQEGNYAAWPYGVTGELKDVSFQAASSLLEFIKYFGLLKLTLFNMQWVALSASTGAGSYSAMADSSSMFMLTFNSMMKGFADQFDQQVGRRLFKWNDGRFPGMTKRPKLTISPIEKVISLTELGQFLSAINWMDLGPDDLKAIREVSGFLPKTLPEGATTKAETMNEKATGTGGTEAPPEGEVPPALDEKKQAETELAHRVLRTFLNMKQYRKG